MFKLLLSASLFVTASAFGQMTKTPIPQELAAKSLPAPSTSELQPNQNLLQTDQRGDVRVSPNAIPRKAGFNEMIIGNTQYDQQTNACIQNRFVRSGDDLIAVWTQSLQVSPFADRGTGLNLSADTVPLGTTFHLIALKMSALDGQMFSRRLAGVKW